MKTYWIGFLTVMMLALMLAACGGNGGGTTAGGSGGSSSPTPTAKSSGGSGTVTPPPTSESTVPLTSIRMLDQTHGWALTKVAILKTVDGGLTWQDITPAGVRLSEHSAADFMDANYAWIAELQGTTVTVLRTSDGGANWQSSTFTSQQSGLDRPHFINTQDGWIALGTAQGMFHTTEDVFQTTDGGQTWTKVASTDNPASGLPASGNKTGISFMSATNGWITADIPANYAWLYKTTDGGKTWHSQSLPNPSGVSEVGEYITTPPVFFGNDGLMPVLIGASNQPGIDLYVTHNGGQSWTPTMFTNINSHNVYVVDMHHTWATATSTSGTTTVYTTSNGGQSWQQLATLSQSIGELSFVDDQNGWAIGTPDSSMPLLLHTTDGGHTWQSISYTMQK
jgi:photosystem II stability/assembly factor-like uncharacterized protein